MGGLYNELFGNNPATVLIAPMLTEENPGAFFPRFRDCYVEDGDIIVYTRVGGGNRETGYGEEKLYGMPTFKETWDDDFDCTYGYYRFGVPEEWADDFKAITEGRMADVSDSYVARVGKCFGVSPEAMREKLPGEIEPGELGGKPDWEGFFDMLRSVK